MYSVKVSDNLYHWNDLFRLANTSGDFLSVCNRHKGFFLGTRTLLLVDDDESVLSGLSVILEAHEFEVTTASNVNEALKHIVSESFDVLLSDLHMPGAGDGLIVAGAMRHVNPRRSR